MGASKRLRAVALAVGLVVLVGAPDGAQATWVQVPSPNPPGSNELQGAAAPPPAMSGAVGTRQVASGGLVTLVEHWDGTSWSTVASPTRTRAA
jgi:hypothetical protein